jgi:hypothetical protein
MEKTRVVPTVINSANEHRSKMLKLLKDKCLFLHDTGKPFVLVKSGSSYKLESGIFNARAVKGGFGTKDISFIKKVKKYIVDNDIADKFIGTDYQAKKIEYIEVKDFSDGEVISDLVEIDIDKAYWETAYLLGVVDRRIYKQGLAVDKKVRLAALGSLAKITERWVFDGKEMKKAKNERSYATENIWFAICRRVADAMQECVKIAADDFVFYWVDGIYIRNKPNVLGEVMQCLNKWGYQSKSKNVRDVVFTGTHFVVQGLVDEDKREFTYPSAKREKVGTVRQYNEDLKLKQLAEEIFICKK